MVCLAGRGAHVRRLVPSVPATLASACCLPRVLAYALLRVPCRLAVATNASHTACKQAAEALNGP